MYLHLICFVNKRQQQLFFLPTIPKLPHKMSDVCFAVWALGFPMVGMHLVWCGPLPPWRGWCVPQSANWVESTPVALWVHWWKGILASCIFLVLYWYGASVCLGEDRRWWCFWSSANSLQQPPSAWLWQVQLCFSWAALEKVAFLASFLCQHLCLCHTEQPLKACSCFLSNYTQPLLIKGGGRSP